MYLQCDIFWLQLHTYAYSRLIKGSWEGHFILQFYKQLYLLYSTFRAALWCLKTARNTTNSHFSQKREIETCYIRRQPKAIVQCNYYKWKGNSLLNYCPWLQCNCRCLSFSFSWLTWNHLWWGRPQSTNQNSLRRPKTISDMMIGRLVVKSISQYYICLVQTLSKCLFSFVLPQNSFSKFCYVQISMIYS